MSAQLPWIQHPDGMLTNLDTGAQVRQEGAQVVISRPGQPDVVIDCTAADLAAGLLAAVQTAANPVVTPAPPPPPSLTWTSITPDTAASGAGDYLATVAGSGFDALLTQTNYFLLDDGAGNGIYTDQIDGSGGSDISMTLDFGEGFSAPGTYTLKYSLDMGLTLISTGLTVTVS